MQKTINKQNKHRFKIVPKCVRCKKYSVKYKNIKFDKKEYHNLCDRCYRKLPEFRDNDDFVDEYLNN